MEIIKWNDDEGMPTVISANPTSVVLGVGCQKVTVTRSTLLELAKLPNKKTFTEFHPGWCWRWNLWSESDNDETTYSLGPVHRGALLQLAEKMRWEDGKCFLSIGDEDIDHVYNDNDYHPYYVATEAEAKKLFPKAYGE